MELRPGAPAGDGVAARFVYRREYHVRVDLRRRQAAPPLGEGAGDQLRRAALLWVAEAEDLRRDASARRRV